MVGSIVPGTEAGGLGVRTPEIGHSFALHRRLAVRRARGETDRRRDSSV
jgi:hypothetical protein